MASARFPAPVKFPHPVTVTPTTPRDARSHLLFSKVKKMLLRAFCPRDSNRPQMLAWLSRRNIFGMWIGWQDEAIRHWESSFLQYIREEARLAKGIF